MTTHSQERWTVQRQRHRQRYVSTRPPHDLWPTIYHCHNRIVAPLQNLAIVHHENIRNLAQSRSRFIIVDRYRLLTEIR